MAWRDQLGTVEFHDGGTKRTLVGAMFRGVPFHVDTSERSGGRRVVRHEFPGRDLPFVEDLGRAARGFQVEGYVLGADYLTARNALLDALEEAGPGELAHPYYGSIRVICASYRVRESSQDGGLARFSIEFEPTSEVSPNATVAGPAAVEASAAAAAEAVGEDLVDTYRADALPPTLLGSLTGALGAARAELERALAPFVLGTQELAALKRELDHLVLDADALVRRPLEVVSRLQAVFVSLAAAPLRPSLGIRALLQAYGFDPGPRPPETTATRILEAASWDALVRLIRSLVVVEAARLAPTETYASYDEAAAVRDAIGERIDEQAELAGDDAYAALVQLRADLVRAVPGEDSDLPRLQRVTPGYTVPSIVLAHQLYGDVAREADLVARNGVVRPGFVLGGVELEVLGA